MLKDLKTSYMLWVWFWTIEINASFVNDFSGCRFQPWIQYYLCSVDNVDAILQHSKRKTMPAPKRLHSEDRQKDNEPHWEI